MSIGSSLVARLTRWVPHKKPPAEPEPWSESEEYIPEVHVRYEPVMTERVYVWDVVVRLTHWAIALSMVVLVVTGLYIGNPSIVGDSATTGGFLMAKMKLVHYFAAIVFTLAVLSRVLWMFIGTQYARWDQFVPLAKNRWKKLLGTLSFYVFIRPRPPETVGHNPLAAAAYLAVFFLYLVMILTGLGLYAISADVGSYMRWFDWLLPVFGGAQSARWIHHIVMWLLLGFVAHHIFSAILLSQTEKDGTVDSIFTGYKHISTEQLDGAVREGVDPRDNG